MAHNPRSINKQNFRKTYLLRFFTRCGIFVAAILLFLFGRQQFDVVLGLNFFKHFTLLHLLWIAWMFDMIMQLIPSTGYWPLGSQKYWGAYYVPINKRVDLSHLKQILSPKQLRKYLTIKNIHQHINRIHMSKYINQRRLIAFVKRSTRDAYYIAIIWIMMIIVFAILYKFKIMDHSILLLIAVAFYLSDVICVLFWCPFKVLFMGNRCCTTCRIFNWDHLMMFSPLIFIPGFFSWTLAGMAVVIFLVWEITFFVHPERFWEDTNNSLSCSNCTDELCGKRFMIKDN